MSPKIINKDEKRSQIASACEKLLLEKGIRNITVAQVAKEAGIGKGTVYEYFENKYDIVFEVISNRIKSHLEYFDTATSNVETTREKILIYYTSICGESHAQKCNIDGYRDYLSVSLSEDIQEMKEFNTIISNEFKVKIQAIIDEGINKKELIPQANNFVDAMLSFEKGIAIRRMTAEGFNAKVSCELFINSLFDLLEINIDK